MLETAPEGNIFSWLRNSLSAPRIRPRLKLLHLQDSFASLPDVDGALVSFIPINLVAFRSRPKLHLRSSLCVISSASSVWRGLGTSGGTLPRPVHRIPPAILAGPQNGLAHRRGTAGRASGGAGVGRRYEQPGKARHGSIVLSDSNKRVLKL